MAPLAGEIAPTRRIAGRFDVPLWVRAERDWQEWEGGNDSHAILGFTRRISDVIFLECEPSLWGAR